MNRVVQSIALFLLMPHASASFAFQAPEMRVGISADEIFTGESVDYTVEIRNTENPMRPDMSALKELFEVIDAGDEASNQSSTTIINGRISQSVYFSHVYKFRLIPKQAGDLQIPSPVTEVDGKTLTGRKLSLRVITPEPQDLVVVEMKSSQAKVYPTQPFTVTLTILVRPLPDNSNTDPLRPLRREPPHIEANWVDTPDGLEAGPLRDWLQPLVSRNSIGLTLNNIGSGGFFGETAVFDLANGREVRDDLDGKSVNYFKYELSRTFTGVKFGKYSLGPTVIKGAFVSGVEAKGYLARRLVASTPALDVEVREVPRPRPTNYCGGVGEFVAEAKTSTTKLRVGDPLTLTVQFKRSSESGSLDLLSAPDLSTVEPLITNFDLIDNDPTGRVNGQAKEFEYVLRPKLADANIPALSFSTFDPATESFKDFNTLPVTLEVNGSVGLSSGDLVGSLSPANTSLKSRSEGIFQNITDPKAMHDERVHWTSWSQLVAGVWTLSGAACALVLLRRRKSSDTIGIRRQQAKRVASKRIAEARSALGRGDTKQAMREVRSAIFGMVADSFNRVSEGLTASDVEHLLAIAKVDDQERRTINELLESIEASEYGAGLSKEPASTIEEATKWIARVAPQLERGL